MMQLQSITAILLLIFLSACAPAMPAPLPTQTAQPIIEPTSTELPPRPAIDAGAPRLSTGRLRLWGDKTASVTADRLGKGIPYAMALSPDGKTIAVMGIVGVSTYNFDSLKEIWTSLLEPRRPSATIGRGQIVWSPDGSQLATQSEVGITVWNARTGEQLLILKGSEYFNAITWTDDGSLAMRGGDVGKETLWNVQSGEVLFTIETNDMPSASDLNEWAGALAAALDRGIVVWNTHTEQPLYSPLKVCDGYCVNALELSPDGTHVAVAVTDKLDQLSVWDLKAGKQLFNTEAPANYAGTHFVWSPDSKYLAASFITGSIRIWEVAAGKTIQTLSIPKIVDLAWSSDGNHLISLSQYESLTVWDIETGKPQRSLGEHTSWVLDLAWSPDGSMLASGAEDGEIAIWDPNTGRQLRSFHDPKGWVRNLTWSPDGKKIATGGQNKITIRDLSTGEQLQEINLNTQALFSLSWSPDGNALASLSYEGTTILWDPSTSKQLQKLPTNYGSGNLVWSPRGDLLSTGYPYTDFQGEQVTIWDPHTGEAVLTHKGVHDLAWSPEGGMVASISDNGTGFIDDDMTLVLWDPRSGADVRSFDIGSLLFGVDWSPDGKYLVVSTAQETDNALLVLDATTGEELHRFTGHYDVVGRVAWSPRGDFIASCSPDGTVIIWRIGQAK